MKKTYVIHLEFKDKEYPKQTIEEILQFAFKHTDISLAGIEDIQYIQDIGLEK